MKDKSKIIRVLLADDHPLIRLGVRTAISCVKDIQISAEAADAHEVLSLYRQVSFDVLVLDIRMPGPSTREVITAIKQDCPKSSILILSAFDDHIYVQTFSHLGIRGYILKDEVIENIACAIRCVARGETWFSPRIMDKLYDHFTSDAKRDALSTRELDVLNLIKEGYINKEIAVKLSISERTVRHYAENILRKLNVQNRIEAVRAAQKGGLISL